MRTTSVPSRTLFSLKRLQMEDSFLDRKRLKPKELLWQQCKGRHFVSFVMDNCGAKVQEHCFNISRDIVYLASYNF